MPFSDTQKSDIDRRIHDALRPYRLRFWCILIGTGVALAAGLWFYQAGQSDLAAESCHRIQDGRRLGNEQRAVFHAYLEKSLQIARREIPLFPAPPGLRPLIDQQLRLEEQLLHAEEPLPPIRC